MLSGIGVVAYAARRFGLSLNEGNSLSPVEAFYPEIAGHKTKETFAFSTNITRNRVNIFNFSEAKIDQTAAETAFNFWERTAYTGLHLRLNSDPKNTIEGELTPEESGVEYFVFIVDPDAPNPSWNQTGQPALTTRAENNHRRVNLSLIRLEPVQGDETQLYVSNQIKANAEFYTEACQTSVILKPTAASSTRMAQEIFCNSISDAIFANFLGRNYTEYFQTENKFKYTFPALGEEATVNPIPEDLFNKIKALNLPPVIVQN